MVDKTKIPSKVADEGQANGGMIIRSHRFQGLVPGPAGVISALMPKSPIFPGSGGREF